jgi:hypothetical protein
MVRWRISRPALFILFGVVLVMLAVVVLPFVDLPDTAFHRGTAPVVVHSQALSGATAVAATPLFHTLHLPDSLSHFHEHRAFAVSSAPNFLPIFLSSLRR